ncbi:translation initiation factor SUI1 [Fimicolochytrium jonesii]|uniref:translation initiation factor SUI1 n=1 Tax=Fimicolochytrium jonesii TaxID=1396493 RepID=UPI0022FDEEE2|nr:translation initiation factor SUI1 [Fimicolochytrium jonesii]KAI8815829.1 translation initiation factor SUI1 [Fimicolochytrium jonesii]
MSDAEDAAGQEAQNWPTTRVLTDIVYCGVCSMPTEYCEFSGLTGKCQIWLKRNNPALFAKTYPDVEISDKLEETTLEDGEEAGLSREQRKAEAKAAAEAKKKASARVIVKRVERTKRKCVIEVSGLELFNVDLKKAAKLFATKFACGASVTKNPQGGDDIIVQGDVQDDIYELILKTWEQVPDEQIDLTEGKKK